MHLFSIKRKNLLRVLTFHRIANSDDDNTLNPRLISATPESFARQMRYLAKRYQVVSMEKVLDTVQNNRTLPSRAVLITFDDAYCDFQENAWPVLKKLALPVTVFVATAYPDHPERSFWWDRLYHAFTSSTQTKPISTPIGDIDPTILEERLSSLKKLQNYLKTVPHDQAMKQVDDICVQLNLKAEPQKSVLSWAELRQLAKEGVTLGAHTQNHPILSTLSTEEIRQEIIGSQQDIMREIGSALPIFCSPSGMDDNRVLDILKAEGFVLAFSTQDGHNDLSGADLLRLNRTNITTRTTMTVFRFRLLRLVTYLDKWRHKKQ